VSGIAGILNLDGAPVDPKLVSAMTDFLAYRGPDAQRAHCAGPLGFGHALLQTTSESAGTHQPASLDGIIWITADARIDAREKLIADLNANERDFSAQSSDAQLILHSYHVWGNSCVEHLLGDFAFAIWDSAKRKLFCARDHFGVRSFYYARASNSVVFSNSVDCVRLHPAVSSDLNELAIADFLLFESSAELRSTAFSAIERLEPAHMLEVSDGKISTRRYWTLPAPAPNSIKQPEGCVAQFQGLMRAAVGDRLRSAPAGVMMSGGLDSTAVAAVACTASKAAGNNGSVRAYTEVYDHLIPHDERHFAGLAAKALGIPIEYFTADDYLPYQEDDSDRHLWPLPIHTAWAAPRLDLLRRLGSTCRIALAGYGGDPTLTGQLSAHFRELLKNREWTRSFIDVYRFLAAEKRFSRLYLRTRWRLLFGGKGVESEFPAWINSDLEKRLSLRDRWKQFSSEPVAEKGVRPVAYGALTASIWPIIFESLDAGTTGIPVDVAHPFFDLRLVDFLLSLPTLPLCSDKELLRRALRGVLPDEVRLRRKTTLPVDPLVASLRKPESAWVDSFRPVAELEAFVERKRVPRAFQEKDSWAAWINLRPLSLNFWLQRLASVRYKRL